MYTISGLWTQARENLNVTTVIYNNGAYDILRIELQRVGAGSAPGPKALDLLDLSRPRMDFVKIAEGMGVPARRVTTAQEFADALRTAFAEPGSAPDRRRGAVNPRLARQGGRRASRSDLLRTSTPVSNTPSWTSAASATPTCPDRIGTIANLPDQVIAGCPRTPTTLRGKAFSGQPPAMVGTEGVHQIDDKRMHRECPAAARRTVLAAPGTTAV